MAKKPDLDITKETGNYVVMGKAKKVAKKLKWTDEEWKTFRDEASADDYKNLYKVCEKYFNITND